MSIKRTVRKIMNLDGTFSIIDPTTPWQVQHCYFEQSSTSSLYRIITVTPPANLTDECLAIFMPTITNDANVEIEVNGVNFGAIKWNGVNLGAGGEGRVDKLWEPYQCVGLSKI